MVNFENEATISAAQSVVPFKIILVASSRCCYIPHIYMPRTEYVAHDLPLVSEQTVSFVSARLHNFAMRWRRASLLWHKENRKKKKKKINSQVISSQQGGINGIIVYAAPVTALRLPHIGPRVDLRRGNRRTTTVFFLFYSLHVVWPDYVCSFVFALLADLHISNFPCCSLTPFPSISDGFCFLVADVMLIAFFQWNFQIFSLATCAFFLF